MPRDGFYYYATNPLTQNNPNLGAWTISGSMKINRALTQEECDTILKTHGMEPQAWEQGEMQLDALGYTSDQSEAMRKTLAPITYDDMGNIIPDVYKRQSIDSLEILFSKGVGSRKFLQVIIEDVRGFMEECRFICIPKEVQDAFPIGKEIRTSLYP